MRHLQKFLTQAIKEQKGPYMINCISIVLNGRNHRGTLRGT